MSNRDTILLTGDSWGCGEYAPWSTENNRVDYNISHKGLQQYLTESGQPVINLSSGGASNQFVYNQAIHFLSANEDITKRIKLGLFFQTEWTRDLFRYFHWQEAENFSYSELRSRWISRLSMKLSQLSAQTDIPFYLIGGASDTEWFPNFQQEYPGVSVACQSMTNLIENQEHRIDRPIFCTANLGLIDLVAQRTKKHSGVEDRKLIVEEINSALSRTKQWEKNSHLFCFDKAHPNRHGFKILFDHLKSTIPNLLS